MSIRFQADNDLNMLIVAATFRREPRIDFRTAQHAQLDRLDDSEVLRRAAEDGRILISHDKRTMPGQLRNFVEAGHRSPGVILVIPQDAPLRAIVDSILLIWTDDRPSDWENAITVIPW